MRIAVTGSIATDHLMTFSGTFADSLLPDQLANLSVSFLVDDLEVRRGGTAANISFALASLGLAPVLVGSVGRDFDVEYRPWLRSAGVDLAGVRVSADKHTARFVCTTDSTQAQIASFYPGAMSEAGDIDVLALGDFDLVLISPDDPGAMLRHTKACRDAGVPFAADPSQQLTFADGDMIREVINGATYLFSNDYEAALIEQKTGWSQAEISALVGTRITTHGKDGVTVANADETIDVPAIAGVTAVDPTGVGDSFRGGFLAAVASGLGYQRAAQVGCTIASYVVETTGTQEYLLEREAFLARVRENYAEAAAAEIGDALSLA